MKICPMSRKWVKTKQPEITKNKCPIKICYNVKQYGEILKWRFSSFERLCPGILQEGGFVTDGMFSPQVTGEQQTMKRVPLGRPKPDARFMYAVLKPK